MSQMPPIEQMILTIRGKRVIFAGDLAAVYGVETRVLNQAAKRSPDRFPDDFLFQLTAREFSDLKICGAVTDDGKAASRSQPVTLETGVPGPKSTAPRRGHHIKYPPYAFTEHGAIMAATILNSLQAIAMSVYIVRAFVAMRDRLAANSAIIRRLAEIDKTLLEHDSALRDIYRKLLPLLQPVPQPPKRRIGFIAED